MRISVTMSRYFGGRFFWHLIALFVGMTMLVALVDYIETLRRTAGIANLHSFVALQSSIFRVPQITERLLPFCALIATMSCYLTLSRRLELVIARAAGISAWQFVTPAIAVALLTGIVGTTLYNPVAAVLAERSKRLEAQMFGEQSGARNADGSFWMRQVSSDGQAIINAKGSRDQGVQLSGVTVFTYTPQGDFREHIEAKSALLERGHWRLQDVRVLSAGAPPREEDSYLLKTDLTPEQVRENFATPETVPFWSLPAYIAIAEAAGLRAAGYRLQYQKLLARPFYLCAMVLLASGFSLRFFRFGGIRNMVFGGVVFGFLLYVFSKITDDMAEASMVPPIVAAWLPVAIGGLTGVIALLYQEDG